MVDSENYPSARAFMPTHTGHLDELRTAAYGCRGCPLYQHATQTVFGNGTEKASLVLIGEQPGDEEDKEGHPFVGPAGQVLEQALQKAGIAREDVYVTNVVKHFKWKPTQGKRRLHQKPNSAEIHACLPWLEAELALIKPRAIICLGATAAQTLLGKDFRLTKSRGQPIESPLAPYLSATFHPSAILRIPERQARIATFSLLVRDLKRAASKSKE